METHRSTTVDHGDRVDNDPDLDDRRRHASVRERRWEVAPGQIVSLVAGLGFLAMGIIAVVRAGLGDDLSQPVVEVLGFTHTAWLGVIEIVVGLLLVAAGADYRGRAASVFLGAVIAVAGVVVAAAAADLPEELGVEESMGVPLAIAGAVIAVAALVLPAFRGHRVDQRIDDDDRAGRSSIPL